MPTRIRFATAHSVYDTFADLRRIGSPPVEGAPSLDHARLLLGSPRPHDAVLFIAHLLPRRETVWWGLQCARGMLGAAAEDAAFRAAEAWVRAPEEDARRAALAAFEAGDMRSPTTWLAFAAGWSGGSVTAPDQDPLPAPPSACPMGVATAVMLAAAAGDPLGVSQRARACAEAGIRFADGGSASVGREGAAIGS